MSFNTQQLIKRGNAYRSGYMPKFVVPKLQAAGWDTDPHSIAELPSFADGIKNQISPVN